MNNDLIEMLASEGIVYEEFNEDLGESSISCEEIANEDYSSDLFFEITEIAFVITAIRTQRIISKFQSNEEIVSKIKIAMKDLYENAM